MKKMMSAFAVCLCIALTCSVAEAGGHHHHHHHRGNVIGEILGTALAVTGIAAMVASIVDPPDVVVVDPTPSISYSVPIVQPVYCPPPPPPMHPLYRPPAPHHTYHHAPPRPAPRFDPAPRQHFNNHGKSFNGRHRPGRR